MLQDVLHNIYNKHRLSFSQAGENSDGKGQDLTSVEKSSMETISVIGRPTVAQFARAVHISAPNAAYRVASLVKKGYLKKTQSKRDQRTYFLVPTARYEKYISSNESYIQELSEKVRERFSQEDYDKLVEMLTIIDEELMPQSDIISKGGNENATDEGTKEDN